MIESSKVHKILYGGDYNPEQWPEEIWKEDMRLFKLAHIDVVTLNVFSWAALQPDEITYDFSKLDKIMEYVKENGLKVCFATSTERIRRGWQENTRISCVSGITA